jgi:4a-hydroxytetrahydrobiopterin dehydratase
MSQRLDLDDTAALIENLDGWELQGEAISKTYQLGSFAKALAFINKIAALAEAANHHPDVFLSGSGIASITLCTHDVDGLTQKDFDLAHQIEAI